MVRSTQKSCLGTQGLQLHVPEMRPALSRVGKAQSTPSFQHACLSSSLPWTNLENTQGVQKVPPGRSLLLPPAGKAVLPTPLGAWGPNKAFSDCSIRPPPVTFGSEALDVMGYPGSQYLLTDLGGQDSR